MRPKSGCAASDLAWLRPQQADGGTGIAERWSVWWEDCGSGPPNVKLEYWEIQTVPKRVNLSFRRNFNVSQLSLIMAVAAF
jgi:hypothetical protein